MAKGYELDKDELLAMIDEAAGMEDQTAIHTGDFTKYKPKPGTRLCRLVGYIETGTKTLTGGKFGQKTNDRVQLIFELLHEKDIQTYGEGDASRKEGYLLKIRLKKSGSNKSDFQKIFNLLRAGRDNITHMAQLLGKGFLVTITARTEDGKTVPKDDPEYDKKAVYFNAWSGEKDAKTWSFAEAVKIDAVTQEVEPYRIPPANASLKLFIWANANSAMWHSIYQPGTFERKDADGNTVTRNLNFYQEEILTAENFRGSPIETVLANEGLLKEALHDAGLDKTAKTTKAADSETPDVGSDEDLGPAFQSEASGMDDVPF